MSQVWLVTGAGRGLGEAIAQAALEAGHQVVATARDTRTIDVAFRHVPADRVLGAKLDVTDLDQAHLVARAARQLRACRRAREQRRLRPAQPVGNHQLLTGITTSESPCRRPRTGCEPHQRQPAAERTAGTTRRPNSS
ncbi:SDR family NAD(P)-dependent oxidoreductase [Mycobacterium sp.]|uniref:SDR family NAD(P)-dependent oxidoreductase n=1 Tax=Mycobacterium sp. TaxID=1785 RepID=UPI0033423EDF